MKKKFVRNEWREARNAMLLSEDPYFELADPQERLDNTMSNVYDFINASLEMDANPLTHLRRYFPQFEWEFFKEEVGREKFYQNIGEKVRRSDYVWHTHESLTDSGEIITARQIGRKKPRMLFYSPNHCTCFYWELKLEEFVAKVRWVYTVDAELMIDG